MLATVTKQGKVLTVTTNGRWVFKALDDCFGMDRIREWAKSRGVVLVDPAKVA